MRPRTIGPELAKLLEDVGFDDTTLQWMAETIMAVPHGKVTLVTYRGKVTKIATEAVEFRERPRVR